MISMMVMLMLLMLMMIVLVEKIDHTRTTIVEIILIFLQHTMSELHLLLFFRMKGSIQHYTMAEQLLTHSAQ